MGKVTTIQKDLVTVKETIDFYQERHTEIESIVVGVKWKDGDITTAHSRQAVSTALLTIKIIQLSIDNIIKEQGF